LICFQPIASSSDGNAYLVKAPGASPLLIDAGVRFRQIQEALSFQAGGLAGCLISHGHSDHCAAVKDLLCAGVEVYASEGAWNANLMAKHAGHHRAHVVRPHDVFYCDGTWRVLPFECRHDAEGTLGFLIDGHGCRLLYLTDTQFSDYTFPGVTHFCVEANWGEEQMRQSSRDGRIHAERFKRTAKNHLSIERVERLLKANDLSQLQETWLLHLSDQNSDAEEFKRRIQAITGKPVYIAAKTAPKEVSSL
jgi:phosphoribosyl 1,2-cyclic phosphodiesterase